MNMFYDNQNNIQIASNLKMSFKTKAQALKEQLNNCQKSTKTQVKLVRTSSQQKQELSIQQPIFIERKCSQKVLKKTNIIERQVKKVEPWVPINIPPRQNMPMLMSPKESSKQIDIHIEKDDEDKQCIKKLFKKVKKLEDQLLQSQKQRMRLEMQLQLLSKRAKINDQNQKTIADLEKEKCRLQLSLQMLRKLLQQKQLEGTRVGPALTSSIPKQIIKEVIVEKLVQVKIEVPKIVPGPQRIVQKIVQVPKYIEVVKEVPRQVIKHLPQVVEKTIYIDKPVYIQKPIEIPVQVPIEYPIYIQKPVVDQEFMSRFEKIQKQLQSAIYQKSILINHIQELKKTVIILRENLEVMRLHNQEKNRSVEYMLQNSNDYAPVSPVAHNFYQQISSYHNKHQYMDNRNYSVSSKSHPRVI